jgi:hypothetical protein
MRRKTQNVGSRDREFIFLYCSVRALPINNSQHSDQQNAQYFFLDIYIIIYVSKKEYCVFCWSECCEVVDVFFGEKERWFERRLPLRGFVRSSFWQEWYESERKIIRGMRDLRFSQRYCWGFRSFGIWRCVVGWAVPDVSELCDVFNKTQDCLDNTEDCILLSSMILGSIPDQTYAPRVGR